MKTFLVTTAVVMALTPAASIALTAEERAKRLDRIEDRIDRRESRIDEAVDHGPRDVIEDRLDRIESRRDRRSIDGPSRFDRHERRSWWRLWGARGE
ncbi:MAG: hypothetical protein QNJ20_11570 [Paracoccaceae bacterium]|nr:hypothetical protein [Paracoccaceae bacterium]